VSHCGWAWQREIESIDERAGGASLFVIKGRVTMAGGTCSCQSQPGQGSGIIARVPIVRRTADGEDKGAGSG
jgi:hypothetical protein